VEMRAEETCPVEMRAEEPAEQAPEEKVESREQPVLRLTYEPAKRFRFPRWALRGFVVAGILFLAGISLTAFMLRLTVPDIGKAPSSALPARAASASAPAPVYGRVDLTASAAAPASDEGLHIVHSPIVGTFYESPSPGSPPFVKVGDTLEVGQVLCIVEAMKLMNEIECDVAGELVKMLVTNGQPIEYGQELFTVRPTK